MGSEDLTAAGNLLKEALRILPDHPLILRQAGFLAYLRGRRKEGQSWFERAITKDPDNPSVYLFLGQHYLELKYPRLADQCVKEAIARTPDSSLVYLNAGVIYLFSLLGEHPGASALARLTRAAEEAKITLSTRPFAPISEPFIAEKDGRPLNLEFELNRRQFEQLITDLLEATIDLARQALQDVRMKAADLDKVLLVGGSTRIPAVVELAKVHLGLTPRGEINPDECVALGVAIQAGIVAGENVEMVLVDVAPCSLGVQVLGEQFGILHPDLMSVLIPRNTAIPTSRAEVFTTVVDSQETVRIKVYQGESMIASKNHLLGEFILRGIPPLPAGTPQVVVRFDYDLNGIVHVSAMEKSTGKERKISISGAKELPRPLEPAPGPQPLKDSAKRRAVLKRARKLAKTLNKQESTSLLALVAALERAEKEGNESEAARLTGDLWDLLYEME